MTSKISNEQIIQLTKAITNFPTNPKYRNEANTKTKIIQPLIEILGWDLYKEVTLEYPFPYGSGTHRVDYAFIIEDKPVAFLEAKPFDEILIEKHSSQIISYGKLQDVKFVALTNGRFLTPKKE